MTGRAADVLAEYGPAAGLTAALEPFAERGTLSERFAANPFLMAPMAGVSDAAYRIMARAGGAALAYSEMVSVAGLHYGGDKTWALVVPDDAEPDIAVQLFGSIPEQFREAAAMVAQRLGARLSLLDVNMACPVPKVTRKGEGSALLDDPDRAASIVRACLAGLRSAGSSVPVTVKVRSSRRTGDREVAPEFARIMADAGASAIAVHGRTASQLYRGEADWGCVERVVKAVDVPVIGSGDVRGPVDAARMLSETGCSAVMVARGTYGNPWCFMDAQDELGGSGTLSCGERMSRVGDAPRGAVQRISRVGDAPRGAVQRMSRVGDAPCGAVQRMSRAGDAPRSAVQRIDAFCCHVRLLQATGAHLARARSLAGWFFRNVPEAATWRERAMHCQSVDEYLSLAEELRSTL